MCHPAPSKIIDSLGGNRRVAELCEVSSQAVSKWRRTGIPPARRMYLQVIYPHAFVCDAPQAEPAQAHTA